jgi:hypothetical protein
MASMKDWLNASSAAEKTELASIARTSRCYLYQLTNTEIVAAPNLLLALRLVHGSVTLHKRNNDLPLLTLEELAHLPTDH